MICEVCQLPIPLGRPGCWDCCEHTFDPDEGYMCLDCGKSGAEEVLARMADRAKDLRKYGE